MRSYSIFRDKKNLRGVPPRSILSPKNLALMGIPGEFRDTSIADLKRRDKNKKTLDVVVRYIKTMHKRYDKGIGLFLYGSNGTGKTEVASVVLKEAYRRRYTCNFTSMNMMTPIGVRSSYDDDIKAEYFSRFLNIDFLVIDEVGKEQQGERRANIIVLEEVIRHRNTAVLPTILITNLRPEDFRERYGESIYSLIFARYVDIRISGEDKRKTIRHKEILDSIRED